MRLERRPDGLVWSLPNVRTRWAPWLFGLGALLTLAGAVATGVSLTSWPEPTDLYRDCPDGPTCPLEPWEPDILERHRQKARFLDNAACVVDWGAVDLGRPMSSVLARRVASTPETPCRPDGWVPGRLDPREPARVRWLEHGWSRWLEEDEASVRALRLQLLRDREAKANALAERAARREATLSLLTLLGGLLLLGVAQWLRRPTTLRLGRTSLAFAGQQTDYGYLRSAEVRDGRLLVRDIENAVTKSPVLVDPEPLHRVLPALVERVRDGDLTDAELDELENLLAGFVPGYTTHLGGVPVRWTVQGAEADLPPHRIRVWRSLRRAATATAVVSGLGAVYVVATPSPAVYGLYTAEACAAGEPACVGVAPEDPLRSLHHYAARRVCALVDTPIRDSAYDDAARHAAEARRAASLFEKDGLLFDAGDPFNAVLAHVRETEPCRDDAWSVDESWPPLVDLWLDGPRNEHVWREQIAEIEREAEKQIRLEWSQLQEDSIPVWEDSITSHRQWLFATTASLLFLLLAGALTLRIARRRSEPATLTIEGRRIVLDGRSVPLEQVRGIGVRDGCLVVELDGGERIESVRLASPGDVDVFATWIRERLTEKTDAPPDVERLRALAAATRGARRT